MAVPMGYRERPHLEVHFNFGISVPFPRLDIDWRNFTHSYTN